MQTLKALIAPHPPTMLEDEMDGKNTAVIQSLKNLGTKLRADGVEAVLAASTHWLTDGFYIDNSSLHKTVYDYYGFRTSLSYDVPGLPALAESLKKAGDEDFIYPEFANHGADHAVTIPLHFMFPEADIPVVVLSTGGNSMEAFRWGRIIRKCVIESNKNVLFLASGALSHDLLSFTQHSVDPAHLLFDKSVLNLLSNGHGLDLMNIDPALLRAAKPEGMLRDLYMLLGFVGSETNGEVLAYESLPGVGCGVVWFENEIVQDKIQNKNEGVSHVG